MSFSEHVVHASVIAAATWLCTACTVGGVGVDVPAGADDLAPCAAATVAVDDLGTGPEPGCDLEGSSVRFSEAVVLSIPAVGVVEVHEGVDGSNGLSYYLVNWGVPGVGVATIDANDRAVGIWGSSAQAIELQRQQLVISDVIVPE